MKNPTQLQITGMHCPACVAHVTRVLSAVPGVRAVHVDLTTGRATVEHAEAADLDRMVAAVREEDYEAALV